MIATIYTNDKDSLSVAPNGNTGLDSQGGGQSGVAAHCDYLVICGVGYVSDMLDRVRACFGVNFDVSGSRSGVRGRTYGNILSSSLGIELGHDDFDNNGERTSIRVSIPGKPIRDCGSSRFHEFIRDCYALGYYATRFDWAIDDFERCLDLPTVADTCERGNYTGAREHRYYQRRSRGSYETGRTVYLGASSSDKQVRIYDKAVESQGEIKSIRYEVQWRGKIAQYIFSEYVSRHNIAESSQVVSNLAVGSISFIDRKDKNLSRCHVIDWWARFVERVGKAIKVSVPQVQKTLSSKLRWIENSVAVSLCQIIQCKGMKWFDRWFNGVLKKGFQKMNSTHVAFVNTFKDRIAVYRDSYADVLNRLQSIEVVVERDLSGDKRWQEVSITEHTHLTQESRTASELTSLTPAQPCPVVPESYCQLELQIIHPYQRD